MIRIVNHNLKNNLLSMRIGFIVVLTCMLALSTFISLSTTKVEAAANGGKVMSEKWRDDRTLELTISSPSVEGTKKVLLLLPKSWSKTSDQKWPTLWLLHGGGGNQVDWLKNTDVASLTKNLDLIVVMPETSDCSAYSDWWNDGKLGKPAWETYLTKDVREILESGYKANENRAIAGLSMGGLGALKLAANHPKMFQAAASFSGNVDILHRYNNSLTGPDYPGLGCISKWKSINDWKRVWGDPQVPAQKEIWKRNNPYDQAEKLSQLHYLYVSSGTGFGSPLKVGNQFDLIEQEVNRQAHGLVEKLNQLHIPVASHFYSGNHSWPYWKQELHKALPGILNALHVDGDHKQ